MLLTLAGFLDRVSAWGTSVGATVQPGSMLPPAADDMQLQQQYNALIGDLAVQRQSQPHWPQRSRNPHLPMSSAQQLKDLQQEPFLPPPSLQQRQPQVQHSRSTQVSTSRAEQASPDWILPQPSSQPSVLSQPEAGPSEDMHTGLPTQQSMHSLRKAESVSSLTQAGQAVAPTRKSPLPESFFCQPDADPSSITHASDQESCSLEQPCFAESSLDVNALPACQPVSVPHLNTATATQPLGAHVQTDAPQRPPSHRGVLDQLNAAALPAELSQRSLSSTAASQHPTLHSLPADTSKHNPILTSPRSAGLLPEARPQGGDQHMSELRLRASLVEWLADAVARKLGVALQHAGIDGHLLATPGVEPQQQPISQAPSSHPSPGNSDRWHYSCLLLSRL